MFLDVIKETVIDSLKLLPFLFAAYLAIEIIEDRAEEKTVALVHRAGRWGPVLGGVLGVVPQCGFSAATSNLYAGGLITRGTLLAVFLSTSDEMLPILISGGAPAGFILKVLGYKVLAGALAGILVDTAEKKLGRERHKTLHELCEQEDCHCEDGILKSALRHTGKIFVFLFAVTLVMNFAVELLGAERLGSFILHRPVAGELLAGIIGLIPNCAASVVLTSLYLQGAMSAGAMISGLLVGSGVGLLVLIRMNKDWKDNLVTLGALYLSGVLFGLLAEALGLF
ncbi:MAG: arsenic efflux protein [Oscillospiraceae bacterium]|nr:arsenic efflux protein [Oscillospiraceae bacterium]